jgi:hydrogenase nickel incorporation protein HypA/HybF
MHERSLVKALLDQAAEVARLEESDRVTGICVRVGPLSGVEPLLLASAFADLSLGTIAEGAMLNVHEVELRAECQHCGESFVIVNFCFQCPHCQAADVNVTEGDGVWLESVSLANSEATT